ncbi:MAG TPA: FHA domain-containing protein [Ilumatobacteraceae bacterium]|nr:FHA domain-containing protein [Ilumatobacteraceae bacterium]
MTDQVLTILKFVLLGLLYLFFARVLWAVWSEVRTPTRRPMIGAPRQGVPQAAGQTTPMARPVAAAAATVPMAKPSKSAKRQSKQQRGRATRLVMLEPRSRRGVTVQLAGEIVLGRDPSSTVVIDDDAYISQRHVRFYDYDGQPMVEDLGSTNGTFHNGSKLVGAKLLHPGDRVQAGTTVIEAQ